MKSKYKIISIILIFSLIVSLNQNIINIKAASVSISNKNITLLIDTSKKLKIKGTNKKIVWKSKNKKIATVTKKGVVYGKKVGNTKVTATVKKRIFTCKVKVIKLNEDKNNQPIIQVTVQPTSTPIITPTPTPTVSPTPTPTSTSKPTPTPTLIGSIKGNVTWQYNDVIGTKPDVGAYVALIPSNKNLSGINHQKFSYLNDCDGTDGIYSVDADGYGSYQLDNIPIGNYTLLIVSQKTTEGLRFNDEQAWNNYIKSIASFLSEDELETFKIFVGYNSITTTKITIKENQTITFSYDFGYTYI